MNELTITLTEEQADTISMALAVLVQHDTNEIEKINKGLNAEIEISLKDMLKTCADKYGDRIAMCARIQNIITARRERCKGDSS